MTFRFVDEAVVDLESAVQFLEERHSGHGQLFAMSVVRLAKQICRFPRMYARIRRTAGREIRRGYIRKFRYIVDYQILKTEVVILSIFYAARNDRNMWRNRMD